MKIPKSHQSQSNSVYGNCLMLAPDGTVLCRCDKKRVDWYLSRQLAKVVEESPCTIRLNFKPSGRGHSDDLFYLTDKANICVSCGSQHHLTKHHCIPKCFRKFFPDRYKNHSSHDVVALCVSCHAKYELHAAVLKKQIAKKHNVNINPSKPPLNPAQNKAVKAANALLRYKDRIPLERIKELTRIIEEFLDKKSVTQKDIEDVCRLSSYLYALYSTGDKELFGKQVIAQLECLNDFIKEWRQHFVDTMKPQHLPKYWSINHEDKI